MALFGGESKPVRRLGRILGYPVARQVTDAHEILGRRVALNGRPVTPLEGKFLAFLNPFSTQILQAEHALRLRISVDRQCAHVVGLRPHGQNLPVLVPIHHGPKIRGFLTMPDFSGFSSGGWISETQTISPDANQCRGCLGKRIRPEQGRYLRVAGNQMGGDRGEELGGSIDVGLRLHGRLKAIIPRCNKFPP